MRSSADVLLTLIYLAKNVLLTNREMRLYSCEFKSE